MLTATYSLVVLSVEQNKARCTLAALREKILVCRCNSETPDFAELEASVEKLIEFDRYCHQRKVEIYVIPTIRKMTHEADVLLDELESLSLKAMMSLRSARDGLRSAFEHGGAKLEELLGAIELYCLSLLQRLMKEEELLRLAQRLIPNEEWFRLAASFLSYDAEIERRKRYSHHGPRRQTVTT